MKIYCEKCKKAFASSKNYGDAEDTCPDCGSVCAVPENASAPGAVIGDFQIRKLLSKGGMGEVFLAHQISLDRPAALKVLQKKFVGDREYVESLIREARAAAKLNHPNIVQAYAVGKEEGSYYFAMEYVEGETFKAILQREKVLDFMRAAKVIREIADALKTAWNEQKLVHQDIKPDNIMLAANGRAKLADLGLCHSAGQEENTDSDEVLGTPQYISPEQLTGVPTDVRSDIYSLGATFFQFVTGRFPYVAANADDIARMHVAGNLEPPKSVNPQLPDELNSIIVKMMARDIKKRYQTPEELIRALDRFIAKSERSDKGKVPALRFPKPPVSTPAAKGAGTPLPMLKPASAAKGAESRGIPPFSSGSDEAKKSPVPPTDVAAGNNNADGASESDRRGMVLLILAIVVGVLLFLVALGAGLFFWYRSGKMPEALARHIAPMVEKLSSPSAPKPAPKPRPKKVRPRPVPKPVVPPPPKTRPAYLAKLRKAGEMPRGTSAEKQAFLAAVDAIFADSVLGGNTPVTAEERSALTTLLDLYAPVDEEVRFAPARAEFARKIDDDNRRRREEIAALRRAEEEKRQAEARRLSEERQRAARQMREAEAERKRLEALRRQEEAERRRQEAERTASLRAAFAESGRKLSEAFFATVFDDNLKALPAAIAEAQAVEIPAECTSTAEKNMIAGYRQLVGGISASAQTLRSFVKAVTKISENDGVAIRYGRSMVVLHEIRPGVLRARSDSGIIDIKLDDPRVRHTFLTALANHLAGDPECGKLLPAKLNGIKNKQQLQKLRNRNVRWCDFHYRIMNRDFSPETAKLAPDDFWRRAFGVLKANAPKLPQKTK